jgi:hypothetical protein
MPIERLVDHERRVVEFVFHGPVCKDEIVAERRDMEETNPEILRYDALVDLRRGSMAMSTYEIRELASAAREQQWPAARCAFVSPYDPTYSDLRLFELWGSRGPREYRAFRSLGDACRWLGMDGAGLCQEEVEAGQPAPR